MKKPNFFIVGAPRCGTTALFHYLGTHPNIYVSPVKEPQYFCPDLTDPRYMYAKRHEYLGLFEACQAHHLAIGEATPKYLRSSVAVENILKFDASARLIVMLRNPVEMIHSYHAKKLSSNQETEPDFERAWRLQDERAREEVQFPVRGYRLKQLQYGEVGKLGTQLDRLLRIAPRQQVKVIQFDDFIDDTRAVYEDVLAFLGVPNDGRDSFPRVNESKTARLGWFARFVSSSPFPFNMLRWGLRRILGWKTSRALVHRLRRMNLQPQQRQPLSREFHEELVRYFDEEVRLLEELLGRDLSHWRRRDEPARGESATESLVLSQ
jgi:hypothetical protein